MWRSPVAYTSGGRVVAGSNPVIPTADYQGVALNRSSFFIFGVNMV
jgi:hypothetical protein